jgi:hypothetical protein
MSRICPGITLPLAHARGSERLQNRDRKEAAGKN